MCLKKNPVEEVISQSHQANYESIRTMKIDRVRLYHVAMPLIEPWRTAYGEDHAIGSVLVELTSNDTTIWSETTPLASPCYSAEWAGGVFAVLRDWLAPSIIGKSFETADSLNQSLAHFKGNPFAKAALDNGWWLLDAKQRGLPLHQILGGTKKHIAIGADLGVKDSIDELLTCVQQVVDAKYPRLKLKYRPGWDLEMLTQVRKNFPNLTLHIDCNTGYTLDDLPMFKAIDKLGLAMIEQPLSHDDLHDHAKLQAMLDTPICLDESISSPMRMKQAIELGSCKFVNIKPGRVGGLSNSLDIYNQCQNAGLSLWVGGMLESAVGANICAALASLQGFNYPPDLFPSSRFYANDLAMPHVTLTPDSKGRPGIAISDTPGINAEPNADLLKQYSLATAELITK